MGLFDKRKQRLAAEREAREKAELARRIRAQAKEQSEQWLKIVKDCAYLVNTTKNPEVFFPRYELMLEYLEKLAGLECTGIFSNSSELPSAAFLRIEAMFPKETNIFIDRALEAARANTETLKTEKGKVNALKRFFAKMDAFTINMDAESVEYLEALKKEHIL